jgi:hypothetical protein
MHCAHALVLSGKHLAKHASSFSEHAHVHDQYALQVVPMQAESPAHWLCVHCQHDGINAEHDGPLKGNELACAPGCPELHAAATNSEATQTRKIQFTRMGSFMALAHNESQCRRHTCDQKGHRYPDRPP